MKRKLSSGGQDAIARALSSADSTDSDVLEPSVAEGKFQVYKKLPSGKKRIVSAASYNKFSEFIPVEAEISGMAKKQGLSKATVAAEGSEGRSSEVGKKDKLEDELRRILEGEHFYKHHIVLAIFKLLLSNFQVKIQMKLCCLRT